MDKRYHHLHQATRATAKATAMRGGKFFARGKIGCRAGIHSKAYREKSPIPMVAGSAESFLGGVAGGWLHRDAWL